MKKILSIAVVAAISSTSAVAFWDDNNGIYNSDGRFDGNGYGYGDGYGRGDGSASGDFAGGR